MKNSKYTPHTPKEILDELTVLIGEAETMVADSVAERSSDALDNLRERFSNAQERFSEVYEGARKRVIAGAKYTDTTIRENPYQSVAVALGVGVLVGVLIGRRGE